MFSLITKIVRIYIYSLRQFLDDNCWYQASTLTFTTLLSLVPMLFVCVTVLSALPITREFSEAAQQLLLSQLTVNMPDGAITHYIHDFIQQVHRLSAFGLLWLLLSAAWMLFTIEQALNQIWRVHQARRGLSAFFLYWVILTMAPLAFGLSLAISSYVFSLPWLSETWMGQGVLTSWWWSIVPDLLIFTIFMILYIGIPNCRVKFKHAFLGAVSATLLFLLAKWGFSRYIQQFDTYHLIYGTFATIPLFLVWLYVVWVVILLGAEISQVVSQGFYLDKKGPTLDGFTHAYVWLFYLMQAQQVGQVSCIEALVKKDDYRYAVAPHALLDVLAEAGLIELTARDDIYLLRSIKDITLRELYQRLPWKLPSIDVLSETLGPRHKLWLEHFWRLEEATEPFAQVTLGKVLPK